MEQSMQKYAVNSPKTTTRLETNNASFLSYVCMVLTRQFLLSNAH